MWFLHHVGRKELTGKSKIFKKYWKPINPAIVWRKAVFGLQKHIFVAFSPLTLTHYCPDGSNFWSKNLPSFLRLLLLHITPLPVNLQSCEWYQKIERKPRIPKMPAPSRSERKKNFVGLFKVEAWIKIFN